MNSASTIADITFPSHPQPIPIDQILGLIREMLDSCGPCNRNDLAIIMIEALIEAGIDTGRPIVAAARRLGFDPRHVGAILNKSKGSDPARHLWQRGSDGVYSLHPAVTAA